jgi:cytochrome b561
MTTRYTSVAITLHWLIAIAILCNLALGLYMTQLPLSVGPIKLKLYAYHKWAGVSIFAFVLLRVLWRLGHRPPPPPAGMPAWQHRAAATAHVLLYLLTVAVPLTGWLFSSAKGFQTVVFGVWPIPDLLSKDLALAEILRGGHQALNYLMAALVILHVAAALKHHWIDRDGVLSSMLPLARRRHPGASK